MTAASLANPVVVIILSMIIGAIFGYLSEKVAGMLMGAATIGRRPRLRIAQPALRRLLMLRLRGRSRFRRCVSPVSCDWIPA